MLASRGLAFFSVCYVETFTFSHLKCGGAIIVFSKCRFASKQRILLISSMFPSFKYCRSASDHTRGVQRCNERVCWVKKKRHLAIHKLLFLLHQSEEFTSWIYEHWLMCDFCVFQYRGRFRFARLVSKTNNNNKSKITKDSSMLIDEIILACYNSSLKEEELVFDGTSDETNPARLA